MTDSNRLVALGDPSAGSCEDGVCVIDPAAPAPNALASIPFATTGGGEVTLAEYAGRVTLVVNVASRCGLTPQYEGLQRLYARNADRGFTVLGFPANDFMGQEPGTDAEIAEFCSVNYSVTFPIMSKITVVGTDRHPLYTELIRRAPTAAGKPEVAEAVTGDGPPPVDDPEVLWNFEKFLIGREGTVVGRFAPGVTPDDPALIAAIDAALTPPGL